MDTKTCGSLNLLYKIFILNGILHGTMYSMAYFVIFHPCITYTEQYNANAVQLLYTALFQE